MSKIFVGQFVSQEESLEDKRISQAGNNYQLKLIRMLNPKLSISLYPIFLRYKSKSRLDDSTIVINNQSKLPVSFNKFFKMIKDTFDALLIIKKFKQDNVLFYNIDKQNFLLVYLTKFFLKNKTFLVLADYPYFDNKSVFEKTANYLIKSLDGVLVLNSNIILNKNQLVLPGLLESHTITHNKNELFNNNVLLSGSLGVTTGLKIALETFAKKTEFNLYISGRPYNFSEEEFNTLIESYTNQYSNIKYFGLMSLEDYEQILDKCYIALSLRNPDDVEHQYNFPSKILEYLSKSKLVISTLEYKDLPADFLFHCEFSSESLTECLDYIEKMDVEKVSNLKNQIHNYLNANFTENKLIDICNQLINGQN